MTKKKPNRRYYGRPKPRAGKDGAAVILRNKPDHPEETEFYLEIKKKDYPVEGYGRKAAFVGGTSEDGDESPLETMLREVEEEFVDPKAAGIVAKYVKKFGYAKIRRKAGEEDFYVDIFEAVIDNSDDWDRIRSSKLKGDGGDNEIVNLEDIGKKEFIYGYDRILRSYIKESLGQDISFKREDLHTFELHKRSDIAKDYLRPGLSSFMGSPQYGQTLGLRLSGSYLMG